MEGWSIGGRNSRQPGQTEAGHRPRLFLCPAPKGSWGIVRPHSTGSSGTALQSSLPHRSRSDGLPQACAPHDGQRYLTRFERLPGSGEIRSPRSSPPSPSSSPVSAIGAAIVVMGGKRSSHEILKSCVSSLSVACMNRPPGMA